MKQDYFLTMDLDWCPDWILKRVLTGIEDVPLTIFMTNRSDFIDTKLLGGARWSLGIHPNFEPKSSHGENPDEVFKTLNDLFPNAISWRSHSLLSSNRVMQSFCNFSSLRIVSNNYDPSFYRPTWTNSSFAQRNYLDLPIHFEDDLALVDDPGLHRSKELFSLKQKKYDLVTVSFHPIHIYLNSVDLHQYSNLKSLIYSDSEFDLRINPCHIYGIGTAFQQFLDSDPSLISENQILDRFGLQ
jgi:hypothetical protein